MTIFLKNLMQALSKYYNKNYHDFLKKIKSFYGIFQE